MVGEIWAEIARTTAAIDARFASKLPDVEAAQRQVLSRMIQANAATEFGREHGFAKITSAEDFRNRVPAREYGAFAHYIDRAIGGVPAVLTAEEIDFVEQTGGSSGGVKNIPYTTTGLLSFRDCLFPWLADLIRRRPFITRGRSYFALSPVGRSTDERVGAFRVGSATPFAYFDGLRDLLVSLSAVPMELRLLQEFEAWQRETSLHLLCDEGLALISIWSPTYLTELLRAMRCDAAGLLPLVEAKLAVARPSAVARARVKKLENALLGAHPAYRDIWPNLDTISCWTDAASKSFADELQSFFPSTFVQSKGLMSTEAAVSFPYGEGAGSILALESGFFEFADDAGAVHFAWQLKVDVQYRLLVSTYSGLYRYDTGDIVCVTGYSGNTPRLQFMGRDGVSSDLCGEKLTEGFVLNCLGDAGLSAGAYAVLVAISAPRPHYKLFVDTSVSDFANKELGKRLDLALAANPQYQYARRLGQLGAPEVGAVNDLYGKVKRHRLALGASLGALKAPVLLGRADPRLLSLLEREA